MPRRKTTRRARRLRTRKDHALSRTREKSAQFAAYSYREDEIEEALATGKDAERLKAYFGESRYLELRGLAQQVQGSVRGPRVLIVPGLMGSTIGRRRPLLDNVLWFDPVDIISGKLPQLALNETPSRFTALGALPLAYTALRLRLKSAGFDADFHYYDWRLSLDVLGEELSARLAKEKASDISLVAHSMGGLVARAALALDGAKMKSLIMLGTPNHGSFAPAQAIRAVYPVVKKIAALDPFHSAADLARGVFTTFPGLYQLLPTPKKFSAVNLFDAAAWPSAGPQPRQDLLNQVQCIQESLAPADERFFLIAGVNQDTVIGLRMDHNEFVYDQSLEGDGTVPVDFAELSGAKTYYVEESHGSLPNNRFVARAIIELLSTRVTSVLPERWAPVSRGLIRSVREAGLRVPAYGGRQGTELTPDEIRHALDDLVAPDARDGIEPAVSAVVTAGEPTDLLAQSFQGLVVGRRTQRVLEIRLAQGSIADLDTRAYVLGIFRNVAPTGPAVALDRPMKGAIKEFTDRRMFGGNAGEIFIMPTGRHLVPADFVLFAGLGDFDAFNRAADSVLQLTAENVIRTCVRTSVEEFGTVLLGAGSGHTISHAVQNLLIGFLRGLKDADRDHAFRRVTMCEHDPARYEQIRSELLRLTSTPLFQDFEVILDEAFVEAPPPAFAVRAVPPVPEVAYLLVRQDQESKPEAMTQYTSSVLTPGSKAAVITETSRVAMRDLDALLKKLESSGMSLPALDRFGDDMARLMLPDRIRAILSAMSNCHLVVVHDAPASRIPWETIQINGWRPALNKGISRRYLASNLSVAKWLAQRQRADKLSLLLVINPTQDLPGAEKEGQRIRELIAGQPAIIWEELHGARATKAALLENFQSGAYDVVHYAGHAFFDARKPAKSGLLCHGGEVLSGADLAEIGSLPSLVFFNACEAARVRKKQDRRRSQLDMEHRIKHTVGLAEAFLRGGVANYLGTYWPVGDQAALTFARVFYTRLLQHEMIGAALLTAREAVRTQDHSIDWADYVHYGSYDFVLKQSD
jgi:pimeloyl-ACP methyl ester carboxylesterase